MISTIVLEPQAFPRGEEARALVVRSLRWLVGAAVAGVVGEVVIAASADLALSAVADAVGSRLVEAAEEGARLRAAAAIVRGDRVLVLLAGYNPDAGIIEEIARATGGGARLLAEPATLLQRLLPGRSPAIGVLLPTATLRGVRDTAALRRAGKVLPPLAARARRLA